MPGKLRRRRRGDEGFTRESPEDHSLPLLEAAAAAAGLPRPFDLAREARAFGYFSAAVVEQWRILHELLGARLQEAADPFQVWLAWAASPEARARFFAPGLLSDWGGSRPRQVLRWLRPLARDADHRVAEAVQAFGVRPQAQRLGPEAVGELWPWLRDPDPAVRRAAVEGLRSRGVWVKRLEWAVAAPALLLPILEQVRDDADRRVANAVGNSLNDLSKDHPELVLAVAQRWLSEPGAGPWRAHAVAKGTRTLLKDGHARALRLLGFERLEVRAEARLLNGRGAAKVVPPNTNLHFRFAAHNLGAERDAQLVYEIETPGLVAERPRRKRYPWGVLCLPAGDSVVVSCRERIFDRRSARLIDGECRARFYLNGDLVAEEVFTLRRGRG